MQINALADTSDAFQVIGSGKAGLSVNTEGANRIFLWWNNSGSFSAVGPGGATNSLIFRNDNTSIGTTDPAGHKLRVNGRVLVDDYVRTRRFWVLVVSTITNLTSAYRVYENGWEPTLYQTSGVNGSQFSAAVAAILSDMGKPTTEVFAPVSGGIRDMPIAMLRRVSSGAVYLYGKQISSANTVYAITPGDSTVWDGVLTFWT